MRKVLADQYYQLLNLNYSTKLIIRMVMHVGMDTTLWCTEKKL